MSTRLRATLAPSDEDRQIAASLQQARTFVESAMKIARSGKFDLRRRRVEQDLGHVLSAMENVGAIASRYGVDPDLTSEDERNSTHRKKLAELRAASAKDGET